jgi:hypothetical protein
MLTTFISAIQVDIQAAVVYDSISGIQSAFNYLYFIRNNLKGDDQPDTFSNVQFESPCTSNPCQNGGACMIGMTGGFVCYCVAGFTGKIIVIYQRFLFLF